MSGSKFEPSITLQDQGAGPGGTQIYTGTAADLILDANGAVISTVAPASLVSIVEDGTTLASVGTDASGHFTASVTLPPGSGEVSAVATTEGGTEVVSPSLPVTPSQPLITESMTGITDAIYEADLNPFVHLAFKPFNGVTVSDPNAGELESASVMAPGTVSSPPLQNLSAAALASALDATTVTLPEVVGSYTATATITDSSGQTGTLTSIISIVTYTPDGSQMVTLPLVTLTSPPETSATATQTLTGVLGDQTFSNLGAAEAYSPPANGMVTILDNGTPIGSAVATPLANGGSAAYTATVTLPFLGTNSLTAIYSNGYAAGASAPVVDTLQVPPASASAIGNGPDTLALFLSQRAEPAGAQFTVSVDGEQVGGLQTVTADSTAGQVQELDVLGSFSPSLNHTVSVDYLNATNSLLLVDYATLDGIAVPGGSAVLSNNGSAAFSFGAVQPVIVGSGADTLELLLSERGEPAGAQFTVSVDGQQVGGVQTTAADTLAGQTQEFDVKGDFPAGTDTATIDYLNAANSLLLVDSASLNGTAIAGAGAVLSNSGTAGFSFAGPAMPYPTTVGAGPDTLALLVSERAQPAGAQFTVSVDGAQVGGVETVTADALAGQLQQFNVLGDFPTGTDTVSIDYLNASNSLLEVGSATFDGSAVPGGAITLSNTGSASFSVTSPELGVPTSVSTVGSGPDTLALSTSERAEPVGAQFTVSVDGAQVGGVQTTTADSVAGQFQQLDVLGSFAPGVSHSVSVDYLNASNSLLLVDNATIDGATIAGGSEVLSNSGSLGFSFAAPVAPGPTTLGSGPDTLALNVAEGNFANNAALFTLSVDGTQVGGVQTASATASNGESQVFDVLGDFTGQHVVSVTLLNSSLSGASPVPFLLLGGATIDGAAIPNSNIRTNDAQPTTFSFTH